MTATAATTLGMMRVQEEPRMAWTPICIFDEKWDDVGQGRAVSMTVTEATARAATPVVEATATWR